MQYCSNIKDFFAIMNHFNPKELKAMNKMYYLFKLNEAEEKALSEKCFSTEPMMCMCQYFGLMLKADGNVELLGQPNNATDNWKPFQAEEWTGIVRLYKSENHIVGLKRNGTVVACGYNGNHQCETDNWQNIQEIYITDEATAGSDTNGTTYHTYTFRQVSTPTSPTAIPAAHNPSKAVDETSLRYKLNDDNTIIITKYTGQEHNIVLPRTITGKTVTGIGNYVFYRCTGLTAVTIPDSVTSIGNWSFDGCTGLTDVTIPDSVTSIGDGAFNGCTGLTSVTLPDSLTSIGDGAFNGCGSLMVINLPDSVKNIGNAAFYGCQRLTDKKGFVIVRNVLYSYHGKEREITIPDNVTHIGAWVFKDCANLRTVTISDSVTHIGEGAFYGCNSLTIYGYPASYAEKYAQEQNIPFCRKSSPKKASDETLFQYTESDGGTVTIVRYNGHEKNVILPTAIKDKPVTAITSPAFVGCTGVTSVVIPDGVTSIGPWTFFACTGLTSVTIPASVTSIENWAFAGCTGLTSVMVSDGVTNIGFRTFFVCTGLTSVTMPASVTSIENWAFGGCTGLTSVVFPDGVTSIGDWAFYGCSGLTSVTIPDSVTHIGEGTFSSCRQLTMYGRPESYAEKYAKEQKIRFSTVL